MDSNDDDFDMEEFEQQGNKAEGDFRQQEGRCEVGPMKRKDEDNIQMGSSENAVPVPQILML